ncbi:MAG: ABC-F family ATP-binding cassette domain-containing protein [Flavobacteriales bacterium]|nr:ABC-F family ATP-binding cassette domain-containing protein [Flavobacteriales bacterium]
MISVSNLSVIYGERRLFNEVSFHLSTKDKIGLVGKNGAGKSTMLKVIKGLIAPTQGQVAIPKGCTIGYLPQEMKHNEKATIIDEASTAFEEQNKIEERIAEINKEFETREDYESESYSRLIEELNAHNDRLTVMGGDNMLENIERVLKGLGFVQEDLERKMSEFSGGWKMRVELAKILLQSPDVILLDEPTNHLDLDSIEWLESFLIGHSGSIMLISHDRDFLDNITNRTIEIMNGRTYDYKFSYSKYIIQRKEELERQKDAYKNQQKYIKDTEVLINKFRAKKNKAAFAQSLIKKLDKLEKIEVDEFDSSKINIVFPDPPHSGKIVVEAHGLEKHFGEKHIFSNVEFFIRKGEKIALVGKNGVGKTTLLKILTQNLAHGGEFKIGHQVKIGYFAQNEAEKLDTSKTVFEVIDEVAVGPIRTQLRGILGAFLFGGDDIDKKVSVLSGGEKTRLALCKLMLESNNLIILDEPTNHLDLASKNVLKEAIKNFKGTVIIVSHDRNFLHGLAEKIYELKKDGVSEYIGDIYDFLKEKKTQSIAHFERGKKEKKQAVKVESNNKMDYKERKEFDKKVRKLKNRLSRCEKEIVDLEATLKEKEVAMAELDFSDKEKSNAALKEFEEIKAKLDTTMKDWEDAGEALEKLDV